MSEKKNKGETEIVVQDVPKDESVESIIALAVREKVPVETLERLFTLRERANAEQAKRAYIEAVARFQEECPTIEKKKAVLNKDGSVRYKFAPLDSIVEQIKKALRANGLSYRWETAETDRGVMATCILTHSLGHSESSSFTVPVSEEGFMTAPQKKASALTFAKRYSLCNALGIATADEDDDATTVRKEKDAKDPKSKIVLRLRQLGEKTGTKEEIEEAVKRHAQLELAPGNFEEIITRLEVVISDRHEGN